MSRVKTFGLVFAVIGLLVPLSILVAKSVISTGFSPSWIHYLWPSYFILGGLAGEVDAVTVLYVAVSILLNVVLYAYVGTVVGRIINGRRRAKNDPEVSANPGTGK